MPFNHAQKLLSRFARLFILENLSASRDSIILTSLFLVPVLSFAQVSQPVLSVRGQLRPAEFATLSAGVSRTVLSVSRKSGEKFQQGDVLVRMDCREEEAEKEIISARLLASRTKFDVNNRLNVLENVSKLELEMSRAEVAIAEGELKKIDAVLDKCTVRAPFSGDVIEKVVQAYQFVPVGDPLLRIVNPDSLEIEAVLPSNALAWLKPGLPFTVQLDETGDMVTAVVDRLVSEVDPVSQTLRIYGKIQEHNVNLLPGMSGRLQFNR